MNIYSQNKIKAPLQEEDKPSAEVLAVHVDSLKLHVKSTPDISPELKAAIDSLPSATKIRSEFSEQESRLLFETVDWAWKQISGKHIKDESNTIKAPEHLMGNYWILKNGVILSGENHFTIVKQNINLFSSLLNIGANTILEYMARSPNDLIFCMISNGAIRLRVNSKKQLMAQMSDSTYANWGRVKIRKFDFKDKMVQVVDCRQKYNGWESGIPVKL